MIEIKINKNAIDRIAPIIRNIINNLDIDTYTNPDYYPPVGTDKENLTRYFLVMVAMDHRLSRPRRPYEGVIEGKKYHGADLLYKLGSIMFNENPEFFSPEKLSKITRKDVEKWLAPNGIPKPVDIDLRVMLLRDLGTKILKLYDGKAFSIVKSSNGYLKHRGEGFIFRLKTFISYSDPVEKKPYLLAKFLERRRVLEIADPENKEVPVDNHVTRLALRWGIIDVGNHFLEKIASNQDFSSDEDTLLRHAVRVGFKLLSQKAGIDPFILDDFLWTYGRTTCVRFEPSCNNCKLRDVCKAYSNKLYLVNEHKFYDTWYY